MDSKELALYEIAARYLFDFIVNFGLMAFLIGLFIMFYTDITWPLIASMLLAVGNVSTYLRSFPVLLVTSFLELNSSIQGETHLHSCTILERASMSPNLLWASCDNDGNIFRN